MVAQVSTGLWGAWTLTIKKYSLEKASSERRTASAGERFSSHFGQIPRFIPETEEKGLACGEKNPFFGKAAG